MFWRTQPPRLHITPDTDIPSMPPTPCQLCFTARALVKRPKTGQQVCKSCFFEVFETEVHNTIIEGQGIFHRGERVAIGASGGKGGYMCV